MRPSRISAVILASALLAGCSATASSQPAAGPTRSRSRPAPPRTPPAPRLPADRFTVSGRHPVAPNASQDTRAQAGGVPCQRRLLRQDQTLGDTTAAGFELAGAPTAARLLTHFLAGTGTPVRFGPGSPIARQATASRPFRALNRSVQAAIGAQLRAGHRRVQLPAAALPPVLFAGPGSSRDLYLSFRGTQGLDLSGGGTITRHRYTGTLSYVIADSYGFPPADRLLGVGTAMRYLQVTCGRPQAPGGAHWFPDTITVSVPFRQPRS
jgi:hypothetical protein